MPALEFHQLMDPSVRQLARYYARTALQKYIYDDYVVAAAAARRWRKR